MKLIKPFLVLILGLFVVEAGAWDGKKTIGQPFPADPTQLTGAFSGEQNGHEVDVLIQKAQMPGSFVVTLIEAKSQKAQVFYAELIDTRTLGLIALGLTTDQSEIDDRFPPAALMNIGTDQSNKIETIQITPQDGVTYLSGIVNLNSVSRNYSVATSVPQGTYQDEQKLSKISVRVVSAAAWTFSGTIPSLGIANDYSMTLALTNIGVIRSLAFEEYFQKKEQDQISAVVVALNKKTKPGLLVVKASADGSPQPAQVLSQK